MNHATGDQVLIRAINQQLSMGDIIGTAFGLLRSNLRFIIEQLITPTIVSAVGTFALQWSFTSGINRPSEYIYIIPLAFAGLIVALCGRWMQTLRLMAITRLLLGFGKDWDESRQVVNRHKWQVPAVWGLVACTMGTALLVWVLQIVLLSRMPKTGDTGQALIVIAILSGLLAIGLIFFLAFVCSYLSLCLASCEDCNLATTVERTFDLIGRHFWRTVFFSLFFMLTIVAISYPLSIPIAAVSMYEVVMAHEGGMEHSMPLYLLVINQVWESIISMALCPLFFLSFGILYSDLRIRSEGLDLERRINLISPREEVH